MKQLFKSLITRILWYQVNSLRNRQNITVIGVVGSIGKTSTKYAIAQVLETSKKVCWQKGNYNDITIVPLVFFGQKIPSLFNPLAWLRVIVNNQKQIKDYPFDTVIVELGTDGPGQIMAFMQFLKLDIAVVTAVTPEHMEFFETLDAVAVEELSVANFSSSLIINTDLVDKKYLPSNLKYISYGTRADYSINLNENLIINKNQKVWLTLDSIKSLAEAYSVTASAVVADLLKTPKDLIRKQVKKLEPVPGRLQFLQGINRSVIIDDTYNASPDAVINALELLYNQPTKHKIAILGNMNELGNQSAFEHKRVGKFCDFNKLDLVVTVGKDANKYLAETAKLAGCQVEQFDNPYDAGNFVKNGIKKDTTILVKGSQNDVYLEEAVKILLTNPQDSTKLVRQSKNWQKKKSVNFNKKII